MESGARGKLGIIPHFSRVKRRQSITGSPANESRTKFAPSGGRSISRDRRASSLKFVVKNFGFKRCVFFGACNVIKLT